MEEAKAAAYYDELTRKGEGAARFKQGLGFSSSSGDSSAPSRGSALPSSSSFLSNFVKASSPVQASKLEKKTQLESIQNKLKKKPSDRQPSSPRRVSERSSKEYRDKDKAGDKIRDRDRDGHRDRDRDRDRDYRRRSRSRSRSRERCRDRDKDGRRRRSRSRDRRSDRRGRSRSLSPRDRRKSEKRRNEDVGKEKEKNEAVDYSRLIHGYDKMAPAERVKARMKLQLDETADKDADKGMGSGWERFEFNKDAPLDDEEIEAVEDDVAIVKRIGQSFRFSVVEARREEEIKAAHDEAMFGAPAFPVSTTPSDTGLDMDNSESELNETDVPSSLLNEKVVAKQQGSWRDRARKA